jgi:uncharacterized repeat protein (TIGR01451 family)
MSHRKSTRVLVLIWIAAIVASVLVPFAAGAAPVVIADEQGADDQPGQKDLTLQFLDTSGAPNGFIELGWNWDDTAWSGSNSGDTCALFDTDNDGFANRALCVSIGGAPAVIESGYPKLYTCSDTSATRCFGSSPVPSFTSTCSISITSDQPFSAGSDTPNDTKATCHVVLSEVGGSADNFINSCSYPSQSPNSNPQDCVLFPRDAFVTIIKQANPNDGTPFPFTLQVGSNTPQAFVTINGSGTAGPEPVPSGVSFSIAEVVPSGWALDSIACTRNGSSIGTVTKPSVTMTLQGRDQVSCTFVDTKDNPSLTVVKEYVSNDDEDGSGDVTLGDTLHYKITATNNGNVTLTGVTVTDTLISNLSCTPTTPATLAPTASVVCTGTHKVTLAESNAGEVKNTGTADSNQTSPVTSSVTVPVVAKKSIDVTKSGVLDDGVDDIVNAGDKIDYTVTITNTGTVTLTNITATDPKVTLTCSPTSIAPGGTSSCTGQYTVTQADMDAGKVDNTATGCGTPPTGSNVCKDASATVPLTQSKSINVTKAGVLSKGDDGIANEGDIITYTVTVTNTGSVTLTDITATDPKATLTCDPTTIAPGASTTCIGTYEITQADVDAGKVDNTATACGTPPTGSDVCKDASATVPIPQSKSIEVTKSGVLDDGVDNKVGPGDIITFTVTVKNTGTVTLDNVTASDPKITTLTCDPTTIAPGETSTCTGTYTITQDDIDAGKVENTATACADPPSGDPVCKDGSTTVPIPQTKSIDASKSGVLDKGTDGIINPGDVITFTVTVTNTGNVTLAGVTATDPITTLTCDPTTIAPGETSTCTGTYTITQDDIDAGKVDNTATACANPPSGDPVCHDASTSVPLDQTKMIDVTKSGVLDPGDDGVDPGDVITFTVLVKNTGNVTLTSVSASDPKITTLTCDPTTIAPGETSTCTGTYTITQDDIDAGKVENTATACANPPSGDEVCKDGSTTVPLEQTKSIQVNKSGVLDKGTDGITNPDDVITFTVTVKNTGNVTLTDVTASDPKITTLTCDPSTIAPGETSTCTGTYKISQDDIDAGKVDNTATACADPPSGDAVCGDASTTVPLDQIKSIDVTKSGVLDPGEDGKIAPGDVITFTVMVKNTGNVTYTNVTATDPKITTLTCDPTTIAPGATSTCTGTYTITQDDIDAGKVENVATACVDPPAPAEKVCKDGETEVPVPQTKTIDVTKSGVLDKGDDGIANAGDIIHFTVLVKNTGNVTLTNVTATDPNIDNLTCSPTTIAPGETSTCQGDYTITQEDVDAGNVHNVATACVDPPAPAEKVCKDDETDVPIPQSSGIQVDKTGTFDPGTNGVDPGDVIAYTVTVKNTGTVTLDPVIVSDPKVALTCPKSTLAPNQSMDCTGSYTIKQEDIDAGRFDNTATGTGTPPSGPDVTDDGTFSQPLAQTPKISVDKTGTLDAGTDGVDAGDIATYTVTVENTGNVTLDPVTVSDPLIESFDCAGVTKLAPGEKMTCTGTYAIEQSDIDAGNVHNVATGTGKPPAGDNVTDTGEFDLPLTQSAFIAVDKSGVLSKGDDDVTNPEDVITYTVTVKNTGNVTLTDITVSDPKLADLSCDKTTLAPGETATCIGHYEITQADIDAGKVDNTATGTGKTPSGQDVTDDGSATVPLDQTRDMMVSKGLTSNADEDSSNSVSEGDSITYTITVKNTGNTTLVNTQVSDGIPAQTTFVSCDPDCAKDGPPVTQVTWTIASIAPMGSASVTLTVKIGTLTSCQIRNQATVTTNGTTTVFSSPLVTVDGVGSPNPAGAHASGSALGAKVVVGLLNINQTVVPVDSSQSGLGADSDADSVLSLAVPPPAGKVAKIGLLQTQSTSSVFPTAADDIGTADVANVNLLNGAITADVVRAVAFASARGDGADISSLGSKFVRLKVNGVAMTNVAPNTKVNLPAALFGPGSFVKLYERIGKTTRPAANQLFGGTYAADLTVNMIHVYVTDSLTLLPGLQPIEIIVSGAVAHADFPQTTVCTRTGDRSVSGHAFVAQAVVDPLLAVTVGDVTLPATGGSDHANLTIVTVPEPDGDVVSAEAVDSDTTGEPLASQSAAASYAQAANVCVLRNPDGSCTIGATLIRSKASSIANAGGASSTDNGTVFLGLEVGGTPIQGTPPRNTLIDLPGIGFVILNEQVCDSPGTPATCVGTSSTGLTIRAIRVVITNPVIAEQLGLGIQVIVAEAHSDATWHADPIPAPPVPVTGA